MAAKDTLRKETYNVLMQLAKKTRHEIKENRELLKANRIE
jgi:hypothetical protein